MYIGSRCDYAVGPGLLGRRRGIGRDCLGDEGQQGHFQHSLSCNLHDGKAKPLYPDLCDTQKAGNTLKGTDSLTTGHICSGNWEDQDIRQGACSGRCA
jgi:hypothetical protein